MRRRPETTALYEFVRDDLETLYSDDMSGISLSRTDSMHAILHRRREPSLVSCRS